MLKKDCDKVLKEWELSGGFINCYDIGKPIFMEDETVYFDYIFNEKMKDTVESQKLFCRSALELCGAYTDEEVERIMSSWQ